MSAERRYNWLFMATIELTETSVVLSGGPRDRVIERVKWWGGLSVNRNFAQLPGGRIVLGSIQTVEQGEEETYKYTMRIA